MSTPAQIEGAIRRPAHGFRLPLPSLPDALASLLRTITIALFLLTFVLQPFLIPSESMEHTLLVGDFLLVNKQVYAPADALGRHLLPYRDVRRGDVVVFHFPQNPNTKYLVKRVVGVPGDRIRIENGRVLINGVVQAEPYAAFEPAAANLLASNFPSQVYTDPAVDPAWWRQEQTLTRDGELVIPPGKYFVLGDNRNHSYDSRSWGFVSRQEIIARPLVIYFSLRRPSTTDVSPAPDDRLGHEREFPAQLAGFARWNRVFRVVH